MPRRKPKFVADKRTIIDAFAEMAKEKNIDRDLLQGIVEETLSMLVRKKHGMEANFDIIVNMDKGDVEIYLMRQVSEFVEDPNLQITVEEARMYGTEDTYNIGDEFIEEITLENIADNFGRRLISLAAQNLNQKIREVEKDNIYAEYASKQGEILIGEIYQVRRNDILVVHNKVEMRLPREEQIPNEPYRYKKNQTIKTIIKEVKRNGAGGLPEIILSRANDQFLARLFEIEIPEIYDGVIQIKGIARDPGERSKVAVQSFDDRVDPVGACVGMKGIRIHSIVRELNNENIDLIEYSDDITTYIARALSPAKVKDIIIAQDVRSATIVVPEDQVSLAIGKNGQNVRLASKLTGYSLSLIKEGGEDIDLSEFKDELGTDLFNKIIDMGIETAREFLDTEVEKLLTIEGMTKDLLIEFRQIILTEFDEKEADEILERIEHFEFNV
jgi:transcription termination/antitermination protein NusA